MLLLVPGLEQKASFWKTGLHLIVHPDASEPRDADTAAAPEASS